MTIKKERPVFAPASETQAMFLQSSADVTLFGGAAGSGKSHCLLLAVLKYVQDPNSTIVIIRRTNAMLKQAGGLWQAAVKMFMLADPKVKVRTRDAEFVFSNGATVRFTHCEYDNDVYRFQGAELSVICIDESTQISAFVYEYLISRLRNPKVKYKPCMIMTCNPDPDSFLLEYVRPYLDENGIPDRSLSGQLRYFARIGGDLFWYNTLEEAQEEHGVGDDSGVMSFTFIAATLKDNPILMKLQPEYESKLKALPRCDMERLLLGSWYARETGSTYFDRNWVTMVDHPSSKAVKRVRSFDVAMSVTSEQNPNPDWTVGVLMSKDKDGYFTIEDVVRFRDRFNGVEQRILKQAEEDGEDIVITFPQDPASGGSYAKSFQAKVSEAGFTMRLIKPKKDKVTRFGPFASMAEAGFIRVVKAEWNDAFFKELEGFTGERKNKDDQVDATSDAFNYLRQRMEIPNFTLPDFSTSNPYKINY